MDNSLVLHNKMPIVNNSAKCLQVRQMKDATPSYVPHLSKDEVMRIGECLKERDRLLLFLLFDGCFRISEALGIRPKDISHLDNGGYSATVTGKGNRMREVAISAEIANRLLSYSYDKGVGKDELIFPIGRCRAWRMIDKAMRQAGVVKPDRVGTVHVMRHSGALERLSILGNPRAVQHQLGHASPRTTLRYMETQAQKESLQIQATVDYKW